MSKKASGSVQETVARRPRSIAVLQSGIDSEARLRELIVAHDLDLAEDTITPTKGAVHASNCRNMIKIIEIRERYGVVKNGVKTLLLGGQAGSNDNGVNNKDSAMKSLEDMRKEISDQIEELKGGS